MAALVILALLVCVVPLLWVIPLSDDGDSGVQPGGATPVSIDQPSPTR
jgi:hypothetical protein